MAFKNYYAPDIVWEFQSEDEVQVYNNVMRFDADRLINLAHWLDDKEKEDPIYGTHRLHQMCKQIIIHRLNYLISLGADAERRSNRAPSNQTRNMTLIDFLQWSWVDKKVTELMIKDFFGKRLF